MFIYAATILASSFLLFLVQPIIAKQILPWFGGSAAVWGACMVFFQVALLAGYAYADICNRLLKPKTQSLIHVMLLAVSLAALPVAASAGWKPAGDEDPLWRILGLLLATVGLPFFALAATAPLIQSWFAREHADPVAAARVYRLFALSNVGAILGLLAYPFAIEPWFTTRAQAIGWSAGYALFTVLCIGSAWRARRLTEMASEEEVDPPVPLAGAGELLPGYRHDARSGQPLAAFTSSASAPPRAKDHGLWFVLAAIATTLLLAVTNHITQNIASIPFMWVVPLALYLFTFVLCFEGRGGRGFYERKFWIWPALAAICLMAWGTLDRSGLLAPAIAIPLYCAGLFLVCMFCHGELAAARPAPRYLTRFYLTLTLGGAAGGMFAGIAAPYLFTAYWELPLGLAALSLTALALNRRLLSGPNPRLVTAAPALAAVLSLGVAAYSAYDYSATLDEHGMSVVVRSVRNFYGRLTVLERRDPSEDMSATLRLMHGNTLHGGQFDHPRFRRILTSYYSETSGVGLALAHFRPDKQHRQGVERGGADPLPMRIGAVGLGVGTIAGYGRYGDTFRFYEINPAVADIAYDYFYYLNQSRAKIEIALGDARLVLEREPPQQFDVLVIDAFYGDTIPVHLITREALAVYLRHIRPGGAVAFHVSNRYLNLAPVVGQLAEEAGYEALLVRDEPVDKIYALPSDWVIVTRDQGFAAEPEVAKKLIAINPIAGMKIWTDDFNNLFQILR